jgi:hypothetical protein
MCAQWLLYSVLDSSHLSDLDGLEFWSWFMCGVFMQIFLMLICWYANSSTFCCVLCSILFYNWNEGRRGRDRMVVGFTITCAISAYSTKVVSSNPNTILCNKVCQWFAAGRWFSPDTSVSPTIKTYHHNIMKYYWKWRWTPWHQP